MRLGLLWFLLLTLVNSQILLAKNVAEYSEATDVFELMDHVTNWDATFTTFYRKAWEKKFPITLEDKGNFSRYASIRKAFQQRAGIETNNKEDIFGDYMKGYDGFSDAFYSSRSVGEALRKLQARGVSADEIKFLAAFYRKYKTNIQSFVKESTHFAVKLLELNNLWKRSKIDKTLKKVIPFVLGKEGKKFDLQLRPVWWPGDYPPMISHRGPYLILRFNPLKQTDQWPMDLISLRAVETILRSQSVNQRENLDKIFNFKCPGRSPELKSALAALFSRVVPAAMEDKNKFDLYQNWSQSLFVDIYVKLLYPLYLRESKSTKGSFAGEFMDKATLLCRKIHRLSVAP